MRRLLWLLIPLLLLALLYAVLPRLAGYSIEHWLAARGLENPHIEIEHPGWNRLSIRRLSLSQHQDGRRTDLEAGPIEVSYSPFALLHRLRLSAIRIPRVELHVRDGTGKPTPTGAPVDLRPLLPAAWFALAPADRLQIGQLSLDYTAANRQRYRIQGNIDLQDGTLQSRLQLQKGDEPLGRVDIRLDDNNRFALSLLHDNQPFYRVEGDFEPANDTLGISLDQQLDLERIRPWLARLRPLPQDLPAFSGQLHARGRIDLPQALPADLQRLLETMTVKQSIDGALHLEQPAATVGRLDLPIDMSLNIASGILHLALPAGTRGELHDLRLGDITSANTSVTLTRALQLDSPLDVVPGAVKLSPLALRLASAPLHRDDSRLTLGPVTLELTDIDLAKRAARGHVSTDSIVWRMPGQPLPKASFESDFELEGNRLDNRFRVRLDAPGLTLSGQGHTRLAPWVTDLYWQAQPLSLAHAERLWNRYHPPAPPELSVSAGVLHHDGSANLTAAGLALRLNAHIDKLAGSWGHIALAGATWQAETLLHRSGRLEQTALLRVPQIDVGFPLTDIEFDYRYRQNPRQAPQLDVERLDAHLLGGRVAVDSVAINPLSPRLDTRVRLQQLQLERVLELQQQEGLSGEGSLSGQLPLHYDASGLSINGGHIASDGPGRIRFTPGERIAALGQNNAGMAMALQALSNFRYDSLSVDLQYAPSGDTVMKTRLKGRNPDWNGGRPVDFSINIEQNLLKLLQTLQFTGKLTESIEKRYR